MATPLNHTMTLNDPSELWTRIQQSILDDHARLPGTEPVPIRRIEFSKQINTNDGNEGQPDSWQ